MQSVEEHFEVDCGHQSAVWVSVRHSDPYKASQLVGWEYQITPEEPHVLNGKPVTQLALQGREWESRLAERTSRQVALVARLQAAVADWEKGAFARTDDLAIPDEVCFEAS